MPVVQSLLAFTRDGEWGEGTERAGYTRCSVIRGTDFSAVRLGDLSGLPQRWVRSDIVERKRLQARDIVIETAGGTKDQETGRTVYINDDLVARSDLPLVCASFARSMRCDPAKVDQGYLFWSLQNAYRLGFLSRYHVQHTGVARFQFTDFAGSFDVSLPDPKIQSRLAEILGVLDDKIEANRRMNETLEGIARALFKSWFNDFDPVRAKAEGRPTGLSLNLNSHFPSTMAHDGPARPEGWRVSNIGAEVSVRGGNTPSTGSSEFWEGLHSWATPKDLSGLDDPILLETERTLTDAGLAKVSSGLLPIDTVLLSSRAPIGYLAIAKLPVAINQGFVAMVCDDVIGPHFAYLWAGENLDRIKSRANGSTFQEISKGSFRGIDLIVPPKPLADAFEQIVRPMFDRIELNTRQSRTLAALRDLLLPKLISGAIQVKDAETILEAVA